MLADWSESDHPRDEEGRFTDGGGGGGGDDDGSVADAYKDVVTDVTSAKTAVNVRGYTAGQVDQPDIPLAKQKELRVIIRDEVGRWPEETQKALRMVRIGSRGDKASTEPLPGGSDRFDIHLGDRIALGLTTQSAEHPYTTTEDRVERLSLRFALNHEIAHVHLMRTWPHNVLPFMDMNAAMTHLVGEKTISEWGKVSNHATSRADEAFAEAAAYYITTGKTTGPAAREGLIKLGVIGSVSRGKTKNRG